MTYHKISDIEGIGSVYSEKLKAAGITNVNTLLEKGCTPKGRKELAAATGFDESVLLKWVNIADLYRIKGIGSEYSQLLEKAGVDTVKELKLRNAENLTAKLAEVNSSVNLVRRLPTLAMVEQWIENAKDLEPIITY